MHDDNEYEQTVEALNRGASIEPANKPEPQKPPSASVLIVAAMLGMFSIVNAAEVWETFAQIAPLVSVAYFLALAGWARSGRP